MSKLSCIGFFDSGIGGLSVLRHAVTQLPNASLIYIADSLYTPYGPREREWIVQRSLQLGQHLIDKGAQIIVVACNTASAVAVETMRKQLTVPIIAMEPAIKPAVEQTRSGKIAVLATSGTFSSKKYLTLVQTHSSEKQIFNHVCQNWVQIVEDGLVSGEATKKAIESDLQPLIEQGCDTFVLGCTHFPFLQAVIKKVLLDSYVIIDPAEAVITHLKKQLLQQESCQNKKSEIDFISSGDVELFQRQIKSLTNLSGTYSQLCG